MREMRTAILPSKIDNMDLSAVLIQQSHHCQIARGFGRRYLNYLMRIAKH
jgi:hypothetical protein